MKNKRLLFVLLALVLTCVMLSACNLLGGLLPTPGTSAASTTAPATTAPVTTAPVSTAPVTTAPPVSTAPEKLVAELTFEGKTVTYNGTAQSIAVAGLPEGALVKYYINGAAEGVDAVALTNAGTYDVVAKITLPDTYKPCADMTATLKIEKAAYVLEGVTMPNLKVAYDGTVKSMAYTGTLPEGVTLGGYVYLKGETFTPVAADEVIEADVYQVAASFVLSPELAANYEAPRLIATLTIVERQNYVLDGVTVLAGGAVAEDRTAHITYGAEIPVFTLADLPAGLTAGEVTVYAGTEPVTGILNAGTYTVKIALLNSNQVEYLDPAPLEATLVVDKAPIADFADTVVFDSLTVKYSGEAQTITVTGLDGFAVTVLYYVDGATEGVAEVALTEVGVYTVVAKFTSTDPNYADPAEMTATFEISAKEVYDMKDVVVSANGSAVENKTVEITYGDSSPVFAVTGLPTGLTANDAVIYKDGTPVTGKLAAGTYTVKIALTNANPATHADVADLEVTLNVKKATVDMSGISFTDKAVTYNGSAQTIAIVGTLPTGVTVLYYVDGAAEGVAVVEVIGAGDKESVYTVVAKFAVADESYVVPADMTATLTVNAKQSYNMEGVTVLAGGTAVDGTLALTYGDALPTITLTGLPTVGDLAMGAVEIYKDGELVEGTLSAGTYLVKISFVNNDLEYNTPAAITLTLTVAAREAALPDGVTVAWDYDAQKSNDPDEGDYIIYKSGITYTVSLTAETLAALAEADIVVTYEGNTSAEVGSFVATATLKSSDGNVAYGSYTCQWNLRASGWTPAVGGEK
ncbi:MAG: hypothetical protein IJF73_06635 [Clostridia bacterium]|nr:hypothetical protein [Clostridia bacterium]